MVSKVSTILESIPEIWNTLDIVSDGCCADKDGNRYVKFDEFKNYSASNITNKMNSTCSCDMLFLNAQENHLVFIEFKDLSSFSSAEEFRDWLKTKKENTLLKITDSIFLLSFFLNKNHEVSFDEYYDTKQSFIFVYKADNSISKIRTHFDFLSRYNFILKNCLPVSCDSFYNRWLS